MVEDRENLNSGKEVIIDTASFSFFSGKGGLIPSEEDIDNLEKFVSEIPGDVALLKYVYPAFCLEDFALVGKRLYVQGEGFRASYYQHARLLNDFVQETDERKHFSWVDKVKYMRTFVIANAPVEAFLIPRWIGDRTLQDEDILRCFPALILSDGLDFNILTKTTKRECKCRNPFL